MKPKIIRQILASQNLPKKEINIQRVNDWMAFQGLFRIRFEPSISRPSFLKGEISQYSFPWIDLTQFAGEAPQPDLLPVRTAIKRTLREYNIRGTGPADTADSICSFIGAWDFICLPPKIQFEITKGLIVHPLSIGGIQ